MVYAETTVSLINLSNRLVLPARSVAVSEMEYVPGCSGAGRVPVNILESLWSNSSNDLPSSSATTLAVLRELGTNRPKLSPAMGRLGTRRMLAVSSLTGAVWTVMVTKLLTGLLIPRSLTATAERVC